jgi:hypothetical protein
MGGGLDAFGDHGQPEVVAEIDGAAYERGIVGVTCRRTHTVSRLIKPVVSAIGMNSAGETAPPVGRTARLRRRERTEEADGRKRQ